MRRSFNWQLLFLVLILVLQFQIQTRANHPLLIWSICILAGIGGLCNFLAININGGRMPNPLREDDDHELITPKTRLIWLCDVIPIRLFTKSGFASPGDFLLWVGSLLAFYRLILILIELVNVII
jgi:hypothetical protein